MDCRFFEKKMADYLEGNLSQIEAEETQRHLSSCQACSQKFKTVRNVRYALKNLRRIHPSIGFNFALYSRIKREIRKRRPPIKSIGGRPSIESIGGGFAVRNVSSHLVSIRALAFLSVAVIALAIVFLTRTDPVVNSDAILETSDAKEISSDSQMSAGSANYVLKIVGPLDKLGDVTKRAKTPAGSAEPSHPHPQTTTVKHVTF